MSANPDINTTTRAEAERSGLQPFAGPYSPDSETDREWMRTALDGLRRAGRPSVIAKDRPGSRAVMIYSDRIA